MAMIFPLQDVLDPLACFQFFCAIFWPNGPVCWRCGSTQRLVRQRRYRAPLLDYECQQCGCVFNLFTKTVFAGTRRSFPDLYCIVRGISQGVSTSQLAQELGCDYNALLEFRHKIQDWICSAMLASPPLVGDVCEGDELYQNAGEKRMQALRSQRSAAQAGEQEERPWLLGQRPDSHRGCGKPRQLPVAVSCGQKQRA